MPLTVAQLREEGLLDVLASAFDNDAQAQLLLDAIDFPRARRPSFAGAGNPLGFWHQVVTEIEKGVLPGGLEALLRAAESHYPHDQQLGRWGGEIEIAKAILALVESDFITGETIRVDGGRHLK